MKNLGEDIKKAIGILEKGGVAILPTDTLYGLCCSVLHREALERVERMKRRNERKPYPVVVGSLNIVEKYFEIGSQEYRLAKAFWPGPLSLLLKPKWEISSEFISENGKTAVRIPKHILLLLILKTVKVPIAATSANIREGLPPIDLEEIPEEIKREADVIIDGGRLSEERLPSTIYDVERRLILREGTISLNEIEEILLE